MAQQNTVAETAGAKPQSPAAHPKAELELPPPQRNGIEFKTMSAQTARLIADLRSFYEPDKARTKVAEVAACMKAMPEVNPEEIGALLQRLRKIEHSLRDDQYQQARLALLRKNNPLALTETEPDASVADVYSKVVTFTVPKNGEPPLFEAERTLPKAENRRGGLFGHRIRQHTSYVRETVTGDGGQFEDGRLYQLGDGATAVAHRQADGSTVFTIGIQKGAASGAVSIAAFGKTFSVACNADLADHSGDLSAAARPAAVVQPNESKLAAELLQSRINRGLETGIANIGSNVREFRKTQTARDTAQDRATAAAAKKADDVGTELNTLKTAQTARDTAQDRATAAAAKKADDVGTELNTLKTAQTARDTAQDRATAAAAKKADDVGTELNTLKTTQTARDTAQDRATAAAAKKADDVGTELNTLKTTQTARDTAQDRATAAVAKKTVAVEAKSGQRDRSVQEELKSLKEEIKRLREDLIKQDKAKAELIQKLQEAGIL